MKRVPRGAVAAILMDQCADLIDFSALTLQASEHSVIAEPVLVIRAMN
jgi:hypothetical protein